MATATKGCGLLLAAVWSFSIISTSATALQLDAVRHLWHFPTTLVYRHATVDEALNSPPVNALVLAVGVDKPSRQANILLAHPHTDTCYRCSQFQNDMHASNISTAAA